MSSEMVRKDVIDMSCYHPLNMFPCSVAKNKNGDKVKQTYIFRDVDTTKVILDNGVVLDKYLTIPCGKCVGCRLEYSRQWANRCLLEMEDHESTLFLTLTYDEEHLPRVFYSRIDTGETDIESNPLVKSDFQKFMKRLRKHLGDVRVRFFACGEYGDLTNRPHYHAIIFGLPVPDDLEYLKESRSKFPLFRSDTYDKIWSKGYVTVQVATWETCAYTARYIMKKLNGEMSCYYSDNALTPPFVLMSRKPGIGRSYFDRHPELLEYRSLHIPSYGRNGNFTVPKYFRRLEKQIDEESSYNRSIRNRVNAEDALTVKLNKVSQRVSGMLESEEVTYLSRADSFKRDF